MVVPDQGSFPCLRLRGPNCQLIAIEQPEDGRPRDADEIPSELPVSRAYLVYLKVNASTRVMWKAEERKAENTVAYLAR